MITNAHEDFVMGVSATDNPQDENIALVFTDVLQLDEEGNSVPSGRHIYPTTKPQLREFIKKLQPLVSEVEIATQMPGSPNGG